MSTVDDDSGPDCIDKGTSHDARSADDSGTLDVPGLLAAAVAATRIANSAVAVSIAAGERFYDARMTHFDLAAIPITLNADRIAHTSAVNELACAMNSTPAAVEEPLKVLWGSRECYRQLFADGLIDLKVLRTIRDHTLGAPPEIIAALEPDIIAATRHFTPARLGREIDRMITARDPGWDTRARKRAAATTKNVRLRPLPRGMARMSAVLGAVDAA